MYVKGIKIGLFAKKCKVRGTKVNNYLPKYLLQQKPGDSRFFRILSTPENAFVLDKTYEYFHGCCNATSELKVIEIVRYLIKCKRSSCLHKTKKK